jgi:hypothetical protein
MNTLYGSELLKFDIGRRNSSRYDLIYMISRDLAIPAYQKTGARAAGLSSREVIAVVCSYFLFPLINEVTVKTLAVNVHF